MMGKFLEVFLLKGGIDKIGSAVLPYLLGGMITLISAWLCDSFVSNSKLFLKTTILPSLIFSVGCIAGLLTNTFQNGADFRSFFVKPLFWLTIFGLPLTILIGNFWYSIHFIFQRKLNKKN